MRLNITSTGMSTASEVRLATTNSGVTTSPDRGREANSTWASTLADAVTSVTTNRTTARTGGPRCGLEPPHHPYLRPCHPPAVREPNTPTAPSMFWGGRWCSGAAVGVAGAGRAVGGLVAVLDAGQMANISVLDEREPLGPVEDAAADGAGRR